ncbi:hypothetical protein FOL47_007843 [Perkinsus chesapeaki]|uniref:Uncharacterized protein n=1 Tax=Perkinsus chesapeaki TaxID=330153 RepID=A0A7J6MUV4_PERCH|nr:hypothetical protein FOL47_007843 [Perkinsus chesapeaki]
MTVGLLEIASANMPVQWLFGTSLKDRKRYYIKPRVRVIEERVDKSYEVRGIKMKQEYNLRGNGTINRIKAYQVEPVTSKLGEERKTGKQKSRILTMPEGWSSSTECFSIIHPTDKAVLNDLNNICTKLGFNVVNELLDPVANGEYRGDLEEESVAVRIRVDKGKISDINVVGVDNVKEVRYVNLDNIAIEMILVSMLRGRKTETRLILEPVMRRPLPTGYGVWIQTMLEWRRKDITQDTEYSLLAPPKDKARGMALDFTRILNNVI